VWETSPEGAEGMALGALLILLSSGEAQVRFSDAVAGSGVDLVTTFGSEEKRYIIEYTGTGAALTDYDSDGDLDLYLVNGSAIELPPGAQPPTDRLYRNDGGFRFTDVTVAAGLGDTGWGGGSLAGDLDHDGDPDLLVTNFGSNVLYRNNADGTFTDVTAAAGLEDRRWHSSAAFGDLDSDGFLDIYIANHAVYRVEDPPRLPCFWKGIQIACGPLAHRPATHLVYRNRGDLSFADVSDSSGVSSKPGFGFGVVMDYFDDDDRLDVYVANDLSGNFLFLNRTAAKGDILFEDVSALSGAGFVEGGREQAGMGVDSGDFNGDGRPDLHTTNFSDDYNTLYRNDGSGLFTEASFEARLGESTLPYLGWATAFADFDFDSDLDLFVVNGHIYPEADRFQSGTWYAQPNRLFENLDDGTFRDISVRSGLVEKRLGRGAALGDVDEDGDLDVVVANMHSLPALLRNDGGNRRNWVRFLLVGRESNRDGVGARVVVEAGGRSQTRTSKSGGGYLSSHDPRLYFGLGDARTVERLRVLWPSGGVEVFESLPAGRGYIVKEGTGILAESP
jgi:enediyne biosynthesis protein E4